MEKQFGAGAFGWVTSLTDRLAPVGLGLLVLLFTLVSPNDNPIIGMTTPFDGGGPDYVVLWGIAVLGAVAAVVARRWRWPLFTMALVGWLFFTAVPIVVVSAYYAAVWLTRRQTLLFLGVAVPLVAVPPIIGHAGYDSVEIGVAVAVLGTGLMIGLPYAIGLWVNVRRQVVAGLQAEAKRLAREQAAAADQARAQERTRIAREMHDVLAHRVALMVLHAGALEVNAVDERSATEAALIRTTGREALTNVAKHTGGAQTAVLLRYLPSTVEVVVENGPPVPGVEPMPGSGLGMVGLRERVALLDGRLEAGPRLDGGYRVLVALPAAPTDPQAQT